MDDMIFRKKKISDNEYFNKTRDREWHWKYINRDFATNVDTIMIYDINYSLDSPFTYTFCSIGVTESDINELVHTWFFENKVVPDRMEDQYKNEHKIHGFDCTLEKTDVCVKLMFGHCSKTAYGYGGCDKYNKLVKHGVIHQTMWDIDRHDWMRKNGIKI